jgi:four helix bundle protein
VIAVYKVIDHLGQTDRRELGEEIRRSARRIPPAIAERCAQPENADMRPFLLQAVGASLALEYGLILARDLGYLQEAVHIRTCAEIAAMRRLLLLAVS